MNEGIGASEGAVKAGVSREVLVRLIQSGRLKGWRRGRFWEVDASDLNRFIRYRQCDNAPEIDRSSDVASRYCRGVTADAEIKGSNVSPGAAFTPRQSSGRLGRHCRGCPSQSPRWELGSPPSRRLWATLQSALLPIWRR